jgi:hypothetical protein
LNFLSGLLTTGFNSPRLLIKPAFERGSAKCPRTPDRGRDADMPIGRGDAIAPPVFGAVIRYR